MFIRSAWARSTKRRKAGFVKNNFNAVFPAEGLCELPGGRFQHFRFLLSPSAMRRSRRAFGSRTSSAVTRS